MNFTQRYTSEQRMHFIYVFLFGFFIGIFLMNFWKVPLLGDTGFLDENFLFQMKYTEIDAQLFFGYVLKKRTVFFLILVVFATTYLGIVVVHGALLWSGFSAGMLMAAIAIRYGFKGLLLMITLLFPHYLFYVPGFLILFQWCYSICTTVYFPNKVLEQNLYLNKKRFLVTKAMQVLILLVVVIIGTVFEGYVNPILVTNLLKYF